MTRRALPNSKRKWGGRAAILQAERASKWPETDREAAMFNACGLGGIVTSASPARDSGPRRRPPRRANDAASRVSLNSRPRPYKLGVLAGMRTPAVPVLVSTGYTYTLDRQLGSPTRSREYLAQFHAFRWSSSTVR